MACPKAWRTNTINVSRPETPFFFGPVRVEETHQSVLFPPVAQFLVNLLLDGRLPFLQEPPLSDPDVGIKRSLLFPPLDLVLDVPPFRSLGKDGSVPGGHLVDKGLHEFFPVVVVGHDGRMTDEDRGGRHVACRVGKRGDWRVGMSRGSAVSDKSRARSAGGRGITHSLSKGHSKARARTSLRFTHRIRKVSPHAGSSPQSDP